MQKSEFLQKLTTTLQNFRLEEQTLNRVVKDFSEYLDSLSPQALQKELSDLTDVNRVAQVILSRNQALLGESEVQTSVVKAAEPSASKTRRTERKGAKPVPADREAPPAVETELERVNIPETKKEPLAEAKQEQEPKRDTPSEQVRKISSKTPIENTIRIDPVSNKQVRTAPPITASPSATPIAEAPARQAIPLHTTNTIKYSDLDSIAMTPLKNRILFWVTFILLLPLLISINALILLAFLAIFMAFALLAGGCIIALVGVVGVGTGISLFGLIYGATQLFSTMSAGLYEIGMAITVAGGSLFVGVLLYNCAIRLLPFLMKYLYILFKTIMRKGYQLFQIIRRECASR